MEYDDNLGQIGIDPATGALVGGIFGGAASLFGTIFGSKDLRKQIKAQEKMAKLQAQEAARQAYVDAEAADRRYKFAGYTLAAVGIGIVGIMLVKAATKRGK